MTEFEEIEDMLTQLEKDVSKPPSELKREINEVNNMLKDLAESRDFKRKGIGDPLDTLAKDLEKGVPMPDIPHTAPKPAPKKNEWDKLDGLVGNIVKHVNSGLETPKADVFRFPDDQSSNAAHFKTNNIDELLDVFKKELDGNSGEQNLVSDAVPSSSTIEPVEGLEGIEYWTAQMDHLPSALCSPISTSDCLTLCAKHARRLLEPSQTPSNKIPAKEVSIIIIDVLRSLRNLLPSISRVDWKEKLVARGKEFGHSGSEYLTRLTLAASQPTDRDLQVQFQEAENTTKKNLGMVLAVLKEIITNSP